MNIKQFEFNLFGVNTYVVYDTATYEAAIIDPGMSTPEEEDMLTDFIVAHHLNPVRLINTHLHIDHTLGDEYISKRYDLQLCANISDDFLGKLRAQQARMFHLRIPEPKPLEIGIALNNGDNIYIGDNILHVIEVPGHSPGSIALYSPADKFVITGDALFCGSIGRTDLAGGNHSQLIDSIRKRLLTLPLNTIVYPGHGETTTIEAESCHNPYI